MDIRIFHSVGRICHYSDTCIPVYIACHVSHPGTFHCIAVLKNRPYIYIHPICGGTFRRSDIDKLPSNLNRSDQRDIQIHIFRQYNLLDICKRHRIDHILHYFHSHIVSYNLCPKSQLDNLFKQNETKLAYFL